MRLDREAVEAAVLGVPVVDALWQSCCCEVFRWRWLAAAWP